jgi:hypothetical protein
MRKFLFIPLSVLAIGVLAACGSRQPAPVVIVPPQQPAPPTVVTSPPATSAPAVVQTVALRPGMGRIETVGAAPNASAGGTAIAMQRLGIRMDDGSMQYVDTPSPGHGVGDRVELTREGFIRRHPS